MIGKTISQYSIVEKLGEGGMGVVYKARDTKLNRDVALKFLPPQLAASESDRARFVQEAQSAAALNHPNVCSVIDIQEYDDPAGGEKQMFMVMEFVDGQTLRSRMTGTAGAPPSTKQAIEIGIQIADGLAAAHEKGIVHRDIKPENIMIRRDGIVQVMDFGLAKLRGTATRLTKQGSTVGTAGYMSPEQVQGLDVDHRSDIFSLGVLLYELFAGQLPFRGVHETALSYEIVNVDPPPMSAVRSDIDPELDAIVLDCMEKDPRERCQSVAEVGRGLRRVKRESSRQRASRVTAARPVQVPAAGSGHYETRGSGTMTSQESGTMAAAEGYGVATGRSPRTAWIVAAASLATTVAAVVWHLLSGTAPGTGPTIQAMIPSPEGTTFHSYGFGAGPPVLSPDGTMLAFVSRSDDGSTAIYLRKLEDGTSIRLPGTERGAYPFWSPDNRYIGFNSADGRLKKIDILGNPPTTICSAPNAIGAAWGSGGEVIFSNPRGGFWMIPASGGAPVEITRTDTQANEVSHRWPSFLPDGRHFLYYSRKVSYTSQAEGDAIMVGSVDGGPGKFLVQSSSNGVYASGYLLFMRGGSLLAQPFDEASLTVTGDPVPVADGVINDPGFNLGVFSASANGILAYHPGSGTSGARMVIVDREGKVMDHVGDIFEHYGPRISPDGSKIVVDIFEPRSRTQNLWIYDLTRERSSRLTSGNSIDFVPVWSRDGSRIAYTNIMPGHYRITVRPVGSVGDETTILERSFYTESTDWHPDGKTLCVTLTDSLGGSDIVLVGTDRENEVRVLLNSPFNERSGVFSPDGRWIAYQSNESAEMEIYVRPFPGPGNSVKVSVSGGVDPRWSSDGREIFYVGSDNRMMAATLTATASNIEVGSVRELFERTPVMSEYDVFPGDRRFLVNRTIEPTKTDPVTIVTNWTERLKK